MKNSRHTKSTNDLPYYKQPIQDSPKTSTHTHEIKNNAKIQINIYIPKAIRKYPIEYLFMEDEYSLDSPIP